MKQKLREWCLRIRGTFRGRDAEVEEELRFHLEMAEQHAVCRGDSPRDARLRAGAIAQASESVRDQIGIRWLGDFFRDARHGVRLLAKSPLFAATAVGSLALGIGGITAIFSACDAVLIRRLPFADADRLVMIWDNLSRTDEAKHFPTPAEWLEWRRLNTVFSDVAATQPGGATLSGDLSPEQVPARKATANLWSALGVTPLLGRVFTEEEDTAGVPVVVIGYGLWQRRYGGSASVVGRKISLNDQPYEVVGVMPRDFYFMPSRDIDIWMPASFPAWMRRNFSWHDAHVVARLKPGVTVERARESMAALSRQVTARDFRGPHSVVVTPLREELAGKTQTALVVLLCASAALLLIACVNLANLLSARGVARAREVAVRTALGARRARLVAQFLTEGLVVAGLGAIAGLGLALPAMRFLETLVPETMGAVRLELDWRALAFSTCAAIGATLIFALGPALRGSRLAPRGGLREGGRGMAGARSHWAQHSLIVTETALAVALLTGGGLLLQTLQRLRNTDLGILSGNLLTFEAPMFRYKEFNRRVEFVNAMLRQIRALPGVLNAAAISRIPLTVTDQATFYLLAGQSRERVPEQVALTRVVSRDYFSTIGATLRQGRFFDSSDRRSEAPAAVVNESFANRNFPGRSAIGGRFQFGQLGDKGYWYTIVGVVKEIRERGVAEELRPAVYRLQEQNDQGSSELSGILVRTSGEPAPMVGAVRQAVWSVDRDEPIWRVRTLNEIVDGQLSTPAQSTKLLGAFALLALLLASLGLYGVLSYAVTQRTNEIGVRMALGASSREILFSFAKRGLALTLIGLAIGLALAAIAARAMTSLLYGFRPDYVPTASLVCLLLLAVATLACFVPARRASRVDPVVALRNE